MKKRTFIIISVFLTAILLLSLPKTSNIAIRNAIAKKAKPLWQSVNGTEELEPSNKPLTQWLENKQQEEAEAAFKAALFAPNATYIVGKVLFRSLNNYNSSLWIDLGSDHNPPDGPSVIGINSPVLSGDSVVGVIDYVGKKISLVRLITDPELTPSVRVARQLKDKKSAFAIDTLKKELEQRKIQLKSEEHQKALLWLLDELYEHGNLQNEPQFFAKGTLQGYGEPLWRTPSPLLKGTGFNYDFKDAYGPARDLRTGEPVDPQNEYSSRAALPLVQVGDLLVTSGMDGVFPEGLKVATVLSIMPLTEGAYSYDLIAAPTADDLIDLKYVTILPPQGFDPSAIPQKIDRILEQL